MTLVKLAVCILNLNNVWHMSVLHRWEMLECGAGAPQLSGASLPQGMTGPALLRQQMDAAVAYNLTAMRFWVPGVSPQYALQLSPGVYSEPMLKGALISSYALITLVPECKQV